jgi:hypothetical protein
LCIGPRRWWLLSLSLNVKLEVLGEKTLTQVFRFPAKHGHERKKQYPCSSPQSLGPTTGTWIIQIFQSDRRYEGTSWVAFTRAKAFVDASPFETAMKGQHKTPVAFLSYFITILGIIMATRSTHLVATSGFLIMACAGCLHVILHRRYVQGAIRDYIKETLNGDLADISSHLQTGGRFWRSEWRARGTFANWQKRLLGSRG